MRVIRCYELIAWISGVQLIWIPVCLDYILLARSPWEQLPKGSFYIFQCIMSNIPCNLVSDCGLGELQGYLNTPCLPSQHNSAHKILFDPWYCKWLWRYSFNILCIYSHGLHVLFIDALYVLPEYCLLLPTLFYVDVYWFVLREANMALKCKCIYMKWWYFFYFIFFLSKILEGMSYL